MECIGVYLLPKLHVRWIWNRRSHNSYIGINPFGMDGDFATLYSIYTQSEAFARDHFARAKDTEKDRKLILRTEISTPRKCEEALPDI